MKIISLFLLLFPLLAQKENFSQLENLYNGGFYNEVIEVADSCLGGRPTRDELFTLHFWKAFAYVALDEEEKAKEEFKLVLFLDSELELNPKLTSPKIIKIFNRAKAEMPEGKPPLILPSPYRVNLARLLFPGLNQISYGNKKRGYLWASMELLALSGITVSHIYTRKAHQDYLDSRKPQEIEKRFNTYKNWFRIRNSFIVVSMGIYITSTFDALLFKP